MTLQSIESILNSNVLMMVLQGIVIYLAILWIATIIWVSKDANNRSNSILFQIFAVLVVIVLTPLFGLLIYLIVRPSRTLTEKYLEELQVSILNEEEKKEETEKFEKCNNLVCSDHIYCPHCSAKLQKTCAGCKKWYKSAWSICPFCGKKDEPKKKKIKENVGE